MKNDPRILPLGRFLRKTSIDELPQLFSSLKGDMSIIDPRTALPKEAERYPERAWTVFRSPRVSPANGRPTAEATPPSIR